MKKRALLIVFFLTLGVSITLMTKPAHAVLGVGDVVTDPIVDAWTATKDAYDHARDYINDARDAYDSEEQKIKDWMDKQIANNMSEKQKAEINAAADSGLAAKMADDRQKETEIAQKAGSDADSKNQDAMLKAIKDHAPNQTDCISRTAGILATYNAKNSIQNAQALTSDDLKNVKNGLAPYTANATITTNINKAISNPSDQSVIAYQPDKGVVMQNCTTNTCYNNWVLQQEKNKLQQTAGNKYPSNGSTNPEMIAFRAQYAIWLSDRSKNRDIISQSDIRVMDKYTDNYTQALNAYETNMGLSASDAATQLIGMYPNSNKIGLTNMEMDEAIYVSLLRKIGSEDNDVDQKTLAHAKANYDTDVAMYKQHEDALARIVPPPALSASALGVSTSTSGSTAAPAAATK